MNTLLSHFLFYFMKSRFLCLQYPPLNVFFFICPLEGAGPLQWQGGPSSKPGKPKGKKKCSSRQKFDVSPYFYSHPCRVYICSAEYFKKICLRRLNICMPSLCPQHRFQPQNPLSAAQPFSPRDVGGEEEELRLSAHTLLLPTRGQLEARMMVTAFELGLDNITEDAVSTMTHAIEVWSNCPTRLLVSQFHLDMPK